MIAGLMVGAVIGIVTGYLLDDKRHAQNRDGHYCGKCRGRLA